MDDKKFTILLLALFSFLITTGQQKHTDNHIFKNGEVENPDPSAFDIYKENTKTAEELPEMDIFLAFGQSNMAGRAPIEPSIAGTLENVKLLAVGDNWVDAANPMNRYSTIITSTSNERVGPSYSFAKAMARHTGRVIGMVVNARGGTAIQEFIPGGLYYDANIARIQQAKPFGTIKGIIWHQGESNNGDDLYLYRLDTLVTTYREAIGEKVFFVAGELGGWNSDGGSTPKYRRFNERIPGMLTVVDHADYVLNTGLTHIGDYTHFNLPSQILLGQRYAQKMLDVLYGIDISIIDINLTGTGFIIIDNKEEERITSINDFSYTFETGSDVELTIEAGEAKLFTKLLIDETEITEAVGLNSYTHILSVTEDQTMAISIETESEGSVGIREHSHLLRVYPNPATSILNIDNSSNARIESIKIFGLQGNLVYQDHSGQLQIDISPFPKGLYIISINDVTNIRFIKQ
jgi:hypothetical protein